MISTSTHLFRPQPYAITLTFNRRRSHLYRWEVRSLGRVQGVGFVAPGEFLSSPC